VFNISFDFQVQFRIEYFFDFPFSRLFLNPGDAPAAIADIQIAKSGLELETIPGVSSPHKAIITESRRIDAYNSGL
jgi:hypothetical protein